MHQGRMQGAILTGLEETFENLILNQGLKLENFLP